MSLREQARTLHGSIRLLRVRSWQLVAPICQRSTQRGSLSVTMWQLIVMTGSIIALTW